MSREELNRLIADDAYAASFQTMGQYRIALLKATDSAQDVARAPEQDFGSTIDRTLPAGIIPQQAPAPAEQHPLQCPHGGQCGVGGYCDDCPARSEQAEQQLETARVTAQQRIVEAEGQAKSIAIQAQAIQQQGGQEYVALEAVKKWDGHLPQQWSGAAIPFVNLATQR